MSNPIDRRRFLQSTAAIAAAAALGPGAMSIAQSTQPGHKITRFKVSLAQWSLNTEFFKKRLDPLDFPKVAKTKCGIDAVEYVNSFYKAHKGDLKYIKQLKKRCDDLGVKSLLIMCDGEGKLGDPNEKKRKTAVENHRFWVEAAKLLGCHSIRVNAGSGGSREEQRDRAADGLRRLCELADPFGINVIVENHGGWSSNGAWLAEVMKLVNHKRVGTLPDFGNFGKYDRYQGVEELMPWAKGVSAKSHEFDKHGNEVRTDYRRMMKIVLDAGYDGYVGVEFEGSKHSKYEGIQLTRDLLLRIRDEMS